jgi:hypothetical protein
LHREINVSIVGHMPVSSFRHAPATRFAGGRCFALLDLVRLRTLKCTLTSLASSLMAYKRLRAVLSTRYGCLKSFVYRAESIVRMNSRERGAGLVIQSHWTFLYFGNGRAIGGATRCEIRCASWNRAAAWRHKSAFGCGRGARHGVARRRATHPGPFLVQICGKNSEHLPLAISVDRHGMSKFPEA